MTRPGFLIITLIGCMLGMATARADGHFSLARALVTTLLALAAHAAANVLNDFEDAMNGADAANTQGIAPFTGGSRLIQQGVVAPRTMRAWALALACAVVVGGIAFAVRVGTDLWLIGALGLLLGCAYSSPPLALMARGFGEFVVVGAWWLIVIGADYAQRGEWALLPAMAGMSYALLIGCILIANGIPDAESDARVGKRTLVVRVGPRVAPWLYASVAMFAYLWLVALMLLRAVPPSALWATIAAPLSIAAARIMYRNVNAPAHLRPALVLTILAAVLHGGALAAVIALTRG